MIRKGKLQNFVKNSESNLSRDECREKSKIPSIDEDKSYNRLQSAIEEIKTIAR